MVLQLIKFRLSQLKKRKNCYIPYIYWGIAVFFVVTDYGNLFPSFTFFLNCFHLTFCYELIICSKATGIMKGIRRLFQNRFYETCKNFFYDMAVCHIDNRSCVYYTVFVIVIQLKQKWR